MALFGNSNRYKVTYLCGKECFRNARDHYKAGDEVALMMPFDEDTGYYFVIDDDVIYQATVEKGMLVYRFTMPDHDIRINFSFDESLIKEKIQVCEYVYSQMAVMGTPSFRNYTVYEEDGTYTIEYQDNETTRSCKWDSSLGSMIKSFVDSLSLEDWTGNDALDGAYYSFSYLDDIRISSANMNVNGVEVFRKIESFLNSLMK